MPRKICNLGLVLRETSNHGNCRVEHQTLIYASGEVFSVGLLGIPLRFRDEVPSIMTSRHHVHMYRVSAFHRIYHPGLCNLAQPPVLLKLASDCAKRRLASSANTNNVSEKSQHTEALDCGISAFQCTPKSYAQLFLDSVTHFNRCFTYKRSYVGLQK